jgi:hypothetical protein
MAEPNGHGDADGPARKKGRVAELAKTGATGLGRKGSVRSVQVNQVPQPPGEWSLPFPPCVEIP